MPGTTGYDQLNGNLAPAKSVFDTQHLARPAVYQYCGRASLCIGAVCILAEVSVFIAKRGLTSLGVGIWTGAPFIMFGAATLAVPRTRTVCSVNTGLALSFACMAVAAVGTAVCALHIGQLADILARRSTPRPNFELSCELCGRYIMLKEVAQVGLLLLQFLVSVALACFAYGDCLCCHATQTEVVLGGSPQKPPPQQQLPPPPATLPAAATTSSSQPQLGVAENQSLAASVAYVGRRGPQRSEPPTNHHQQQLLQQLPMSSSYAGGPLPMLYDL